jgi:3-phenylpropionate/trans-cinnamate dioxygenase ferredoxin reductase subunit
LFSEASDTPRTTARFSKAEFADGQCLNELVLRQKVEPGAVEWRLSTSVISADLRARTITLETGEKVEWDGLVAATGLRPRSLPFASRENGVHSLRSYKDAIDLRLELKEGARLLIIGAGFIACEIAAVASARGCTVTVIANEAGPMISALGSAVSTSLERRHDRRGIQSRFPAEVAELHGSPQAEKVVLKGGESFAVDAVLQAVGSMPNTAWLENNDLDLTDGILCDNTLRVEGSSFVVAVGDVARFPNPLFDDRPRRLEHWCMPTYTARRAVRSLLADLGHANDDTTPFQPLPSFWTDQGDFRLNSFGIPELGLEDSRLLEGELATEFIWGYFANRELVGVAGIGLQSRFPTYMSRLGRKPKPSKRGRPEIQQSAERR